MGCRPAPSPAWLTGTRRALLTLVAVTEASGDIATLSYEAARDELIGIVSRLESGQLGLEESMTLWERGEALAAHCTAWLDGAQNRLTRENSEEPTSDAEIDEE